MWPQLRSAHSPGHWRPAGRLMQTLCPGVWEGPPPSALLAPREGGRLYLGIRSWLREASLVSVVMSTVMACGGHLGRVAEGRDWVASKSRASRASKNLLICSTVQRRSQDTERYSPMAHTWAGNSTQPAAGPVAGAGQGKGEAALPQR